MKAVSNTQQLPDVREKQGTVIQLGGGAGFVVQFDGESTGEQVIVTRAATCSVAIGDRVVCIKVGKNWVALSAIGQTLQGPYFHSGSLTASFTSQTSFILNNVTIGQYMDS